MTYAVSADARGQSSATRLSRLITGGARQARGQAGTTTTSAHANARGKWPLKPAASGAVSGDVVEPRTCGGVRRRFRSQVPVFGVPFRAGTAHVMQIGSIRAF